MRINLFQKPTEKCPRCLGKGFVDNSDIERLNKELEWGIGKCVYCFGKGKVNKQTISNIPVDLSYLTLERSKIERWKLIFGSKNAKKRAELYQENLKNLIDVLDGNVKKTGDKAISISLDSKMFDKAVKKGKPEANDFSTTELTLTLAVALDYDEKYQNDTDVVKFIRKFETMCASLNESKIDNHGFYWETWVPYFLELHKNNFSETLGYLVFATTETEDVTNWFNTHEVQINQFYDWSKNYEWPKK